MIYFEPKHLRTEQGWCAEYMPQVLSAFNFRKENAIWEAEIELHNRLKAEWIHQIKQEMEASEKESAKHTERVEKELSKLNAKEEEQARKLAEQQRKLAEEQAEEEALQAEVEETLREKPIPEETRFSGTWICSPQGRGKTTLLHTLVMRDLEKDASVILMDSKGDLLGPISQLKHLKDRLIIIDPTNPIAINPLDVPKQNIRTAVAHLEYIFSALLEAKITPKQQALFRSVLRALLIAFPNPTLETFRDVIANGVASYRSCLTKLPPDLQEFFAKEFDRDYDTTRNELIWRLRLLMENDVIRAMFSAPVSKFNIGAAMDAGKVIIINNSQALLDADGAEFFGRFFIGQVWAAATARSLRPASQKKPCYFYIDECQTVIRRDKKVAAIIDECRSQKIALHLSHQRMKQIEDADVLSAMSNCAIRITNSDDEAKAFAPVMRCEESFLHALTRGCFAVFVRDLTKHPFLISVYPVDFSDYPKMTDAERAQLTRDTKARYGVQTQTAPEERAESVSSERSPIITHEAAAERPDSRETPRSPTPAITPIEPQPESDPSKPAKWIRK